MMVDDVKEIVEAKLGISAYEQRLIFAGKQLDGSRTLLEYNIERESTIHLLLSLRGGSNIDMDTIRRYAPVFRFHPNEPTMPCSIEYLLQGATLHYRNFAFPSQIRGVDSANPLSMVFFKDWLYMTCSVSPGSQLKLFRSRNRSDWEVVAGLPSVPHASSLSITVFQDQLWVLYSLAKLSQLWISHSADGQTFSNPEKLNSPAAPLGFIIAFDGHLVTIHFQRKSSDLWMSQSSDGLTWTASRQLEGQQALLPALAVFQDQLIMVYTDPSNKQVFVSRYKNASGWTSRTKIRDSGPPALALAVHGNAIYLTYSEPKTSQLKISRSSDGAAWSEPVDIPDQKGDQKGNHVAISSFEGELIILYNKPKTTQVLYTTCANGDIDPHPPLDNLTQATLRDHNWHQYYLKINPSQFGGQPLPSAPLYYAVQEFDDSIEIAYLVLYAYQGGQTALAQRLIKPFYCTLPNLGTHEADLERLAVTLRRGANNALTVARVGFEAHGGTTWFLPHEVTWEGETHPIVHLALNSHAMRNLNPAVMDHHIDTNVPLFVAIGDWVGSGQWWRPHSDGSAFKRLGLDNTWQPIGEEIWAAYGGRLGDTRNNVLVGGFKFDGTPLSSIDMVFVRLVYAGGLLIKKIPIDKLVGGGPDGPARRDWIRPGSGRRLS